MRKRFFLILTFILTEFFLSVWLFLNQERSFAQAASPLSVLSVSPRSGSSQPDQPVVFKSYYFHPQGVAQIQRMNIWFDRTQPQSKRIYSSAHGQIRKEEDQWKFYGFRYNGSSAQCGKDPDPRHCYQNYSWDIGGFNLGSNNWIYFNHDENLRDTINPTHNTIGRYRAKAVRRIDNNTLEVEWEFVFGRFFLERELEIYLSLKDFNGQSLQQKNRPFWHQAGIWRVGKAASQILFSEDFESNPTDRGWQAIGRDGQITISEEHAYLGQKSIKIETSSEKKGWQVLEKDFGQNKQGKLTLYFYDDMSSSSDDSFYFYFLVSTHPQSEWDNPNTHNITLSVRPSISGQNYIYRARFEESNGKHIHPGKNEQWLDTGVKRTLGWHKVIFWITEKGSWAEIDDFEREIYPYNLSSLSPEVDQSSGRRRIPTDWEMTHFRYFRLGASNGGHFWADNILLENLPQPPDLTTKQGNRNWVLHWSNIFLDSYEEIGMWNNLQNWTNKHISYYQNYKPKSWWWSILADIAHQHYFRYSFSHLEFDKNQANKIWRFMLDQDYNGFPPWDDAGENNLFAATAGSIYAKTTQFGWNFMPTELKIKTWERLTRHFDWISSVNFQLRSTHIGDSTGEDYAWGPLYGSLIASRLFSNYYNASRWEKISRAMAMRTFATDPNEPCSVCEGGIVGVQTIYAPGEHPPDCPEEKDPRPVQQAQNCLCRGDRSLLPPDHKFDYLFDNHDYHPHPDYALGALGGLVGTIHYLTLLGEKVPREYYHNIDNIWQTHREFIDYKTGLYKGEKIYRLRAKWNCDSGYNGEEDGLLKDRGPYDQNEENSFRKTGLDDWGKPPRIKPGAMLNIKAALGEEAINYQGMNLLEHARKSFFWKNFDYIGKPVPVGIYFSDNEDLACDLKAPFCILPPTSHIHIANRLNPANKFELLPAFVLPKEKLPLKVCEENIFKKKVWQGELSWNCDQGVKKEGDASIKLSSNTPSDTEAYSPLIKVEPNTTYRISYWVKTENLQPEGAQVYGRIIVAQYNQNAKETDEVNQNRIDAGFNLGENVGETTSWLEKSYTLRTSGETKYIRLRAPMGLGGKAKGTVWYDEVKIERAEAAADFNNDGQINSQDIKILLKNWGKPPSISEIDLKPDNKVNSLDFGEIIKLTQ